MSIDFSHPAKGDSPETTAAKARLKILIEEVFRENNYKTWIAEEIPYASKIYYKLYTLDLGVLYREKRTDNYGFFGIEIDGESHTTKSSDIKDYNKETAFKNLGVLILRLRLEKVFGSEQWDDKTIKQEMIWDFFIKYHLRSKYLADNIELSIRLKENQLTYCSNKRCTHPAHRHGLHGCDYQFPNKGAAYCSCTEPFMTSNG